MTENKQVTQGTLDAKPVVKYPEHEKMKAILDRRDEVQGFLDWLLDEQNVVLAVYGKPPRWANNRTEKNVESEHRLFTLDEGLHDISLSYRMRSLREKILAAYFDIDLDKICAEKDQMLDDIRAISK